MSEIYNESNNGKFKGKVAIVTGSSSGIGRAVALQLAKEGARIVVTDINRDANNFGYEEDIELPTIELLNRNGYEAIFFKCDVSKREEVEELVNTAVKKFGYLDIICNNAGVCRAPETICDKKEEDLDFLMNVNFKGVWYCCRQAIIQMLKQGEGGKIVNISSVASNRGILGQPDYCASKGAVAALSRQLAIEYGPYGINVNSVAPGWIKTAMQRFKKQSEREAAYNAVTPMKRIGTAEDIAKAVVFLASDDSAYIQGQEIVVDGGNTLRWDSMAHLENS